MVDETPELTEHDVITLIKIISRYQFLHPDQWPPGARDAALILLNILKETPVVDKR